MSLHETQTPDREWDQSSGAEGHAYELLEQARLRCARFRATSTSPEEQFALGRIHRELGLAGWCASSDLHPARRLPLLAAAHQDALNPARHPGRAHALAAMMIEAEDAVTAALERTASDHMHDARLHLLWAMELIAALV